MKNFALSAQNKKKSDHVLKEDKESGDEEEIVVKDGDHFTKKKRGLFGSLQFFVEKFLFVLYFLDNFPNFIEKTEKLFKW